MSEFFLVYLECLLQVPLKLDMQKWTRISTGTSPWSYRMSFLLFDSLTKLFQSLSNVCSLGLTLGKLFRVGVGSDHIPLAMATMFLHGIDWGSVFLVLLRHTYKRTNDVGLWCFVGVFLESLGSQHGTWRQVFSKLCHSDEHLHSYQWNQFITMGTLSFALVWSSQA